MIYIPAGEFLTGSERFSGDPSVGPLRKISLPAFFIDRTEMSNAQVQAVRPDHSYRQGEENYPAVGLSWNQAVEVLANLDKRLPSALEWEKAARG
ncbi:MAG: SUMF1/EgtB/PvdO family nonheme iron enzyme, partial [Candidatus Eremiobacteraeota bacterium]|nr:SUMF1/EgtB/PvdO family nonheme iron enzyme [Candidatus Eremiobacteraeota bacterium]